MDPRHRGPGAAEVESAYRDRKRCLLRRNQADLRHRPAWPLPSRLRQHAQRQKVPPDPLHVLDEASLAAGVRTAWTGEVVDDDVGDAAWARRDHDDAIGKEHGLLDAVGDEEDRVA